MATRFQESLGASVLRLRACHSGVTTMTLQDAKKVLRTATLQAPTNLSSNATQRIASALNVLLADMFALYIKNKNFQWHMYGPHFRGDHLLLKEQAAQILAATDAIAERVRKLGGSTGRSM